MNGAEHPSFLIDVERLNWLLLLHLMMSIIMVEKTHDEYVGLDHKEVF